MVVKIFEVRDRWTCVFVSAMATRSDVDVESGMLDYAGWGTNTVIVCKLDSRCECNHDPYRWGDGRTMFEAHSYISSNFDSLDSGSVIDIEFVLGEVAHPKRSVLER